MSKELLHDLITEVMHEGASDLHLLVGRHPVMRVSGSLIPLVKQPQLTDATLAAFLEELVRPDQKKQFLEQQEVDFSYSFRGEVRFRGNT